MRDAWCCDICNGKMSIFCEDCSDFEYGVVFEGHIRQCDKCGTMAISPIPSTEQIYDFYPSSYANYAIKQSAFRSFLDYVYDFFTLKNIRKIAKKGSKILDVGCGNGKYLDTLLKNGYKTFGTELTADASKINNNHVIFTGDLSTIDFEGVKFDLIRMNHIIEHVQDPSQLLKVAHSILEDDGTILIETPNNSCLDRKIFHKYWGALHFPRHIFIFNKVSLGMLAKATGFDVVRIETTIMPTGWALAIQNLLKSKYNIEIVNGRCRFYSFLLVLFLPISCMQKLFSNACMQYVELRKTKKSDL